jgi:hypothetical protein
MLPNQGQRKHGEQLRAIVYDYLADLVLAEETVTHHHYDLEEFASLAVFLLLQH